MVGCVETANLIEIPQGRRRVFILGGKVGHVTCMTTVQDQKVKVT